jgi:hypothetical protein
MATSTITAPGFIALTVASLMSLGAAAPGMSTVPITRSARRHTASTASCVENTVRTRAPSSRDIRRNASGLRSTTVTVAPMPTLMTAACEPATPPPRITTSAGGTPGTPPSSTPRPPLPFSRQRAPTCGAMRPATSDIGVSSGSVPCGLVTVSYAMAVTPDAIRSSVCARSGARCR